MAVIDFTHKGIRYISDYNGCFRYKNCNYLKFQLPEDWGNMGSISWEVEYYINKLIKNSSNNYTIELSLSQIPNENIEGSISGDESFFKSCLVMPAAKIKYHPNGGIPIQSLINQWDKCLVDTTEFSDDVILPDVNSLFNKTGYTGAKWRILHPTSCLEYLEFDANTVFANNINSNYIPVYPEISYYLYAQWTNKQYKIYYESRSGNLIGNPDSVEYLQTISINRSAPGETKQSFLGWQRKDRPNSTLYYTSQEGDSKKYSCDFFLDEPNDITLVATYRSVTDDGDLVWYYPNGGLGGLKIVSQNKVSYTLLPDSNPDDNGSDWQGFLPYRLGYQFAGWKSCKTGDGKNPGTLITNSIQGRAWEAQWTPLTGTRVFNSSENYYKEETNNNMYHQYTTNVLITPSPVDRTILFAPSKCEGSFTWFTYIETIRVFDDTGTTVPGSYSRWSYHKDVDVSSAERSFNLLANRTYQIEFSSEKMASGDNSKYTWTINATIPTKTKTISPNGGMIKSPITSDYTYEGISLNFTPGKDYTGISSNSNSIIASSEQLPSLPIFYATSSYANSGRWWERWIGTTDQIPSCLQVNINNEEYWAAQTQNTDFSVSAVWNPNLFYIKYNGNKNDSMTIMSNTAHKFKEPVSLSSNLYTRTTKINLDIRHGNFNNLANWINNELPDHAWPSGGSDDIVVVSIDHSHTGWSYNDKSLEANYNQPYDTFKSDLNLDSDALIYYGDMIELIAIWQFNNIILPEMKKDGFRFLGWFSEAENGIRIGGGGDSYTYDGEEITLYAHWEPIGLVQIYTDKGWKYAIPYVYSEDPETKQVSWKRAMSYTHDGTDWKQGAGSGQNMTDDQLENL